MPLQQRDSDNDESSDNNNDNKDDDFLSITNATQDDYRHGTKIIDNSNNNYLQHIDVDDDKQQHQSAKPLEQQSQSCVVSINGEEGDEGEETHK